MLTLRPNGGRPNGGRQRPGRRGLAWWNGRLRTLLFDLVVALMALQTADSEHDHQSLPLLVLVPVLVVIAAALFVRRRFPLVLGGAVVLLSFFAPSGPVVAVCSYTGIKQRGPSATGWLAVSAGALAALVSVLRTGTPGYVIWQLLFSLVISVAAPMLAGLWRSQRARLLVTLRERAEQAERERDLLSERAVAAERRRIAREMHDVVAHRVSLISLQAGALSVTSSDQNVGSVAENIRQASTTALTELRGMLRALRDDDEEVRDASAEPGTALEPQPSLASVRELVEDAVALGDRIDLELPEPVPEVPSSVQRAAYRVIQESLTNAAKHAPGARIRVVVTAGDEELALQVSNDAPYSGASSAVPGSGYGLLGMRERVSLAGGTLRAEPDDGGFQVLAWFPWEQEEESA